MDTSWGYQFYDTGTCCKEKKYRSKVKNESFSNIAMTISYAFQSTLVNVLVINRSVQAHTHATSISSKASSLLGKKGRALNRYCARMELRARARWLWTVLQWVALLLFWLKTAEGEIESATIKEIQSDPNFIDFFQIRAFFFEYITWYKILFVRPYHSRLHGLDKPQYLNFQEIEQRMTLFRLIWILDWVLL